MTAVERIVLQVIVRARLSSIIIDIEENMRSLV